jgi:hypothetical protein
VRFDAFAEPSANGRYLGNPAVHGNGTFTGLKTSATLPKVQANFHWSYLTAGIVRRSRAVERRARYLPTRHESFPVTARWRLYVLKLARATRRDQTHEKGARRDGR